VASPPAVDGSGEGSDERIRVRFVLEQDDEGWPPAASEDIWAVPISPEVARVDSIPWFVQNIALDDLIGVRSVGEGRATYAEKLRWSGNCTIRIVPLADGPAAGIRELVDLLSPYNVEIEIVEQFGIVAANVRSSVNVVALKKLLDQGERRGIWSYEEGCVGGSWPG
jgi:hypothetical protein